MESRFRYQVTPYSPIKDLIPGQSLRRAFTSDLTKDEVLLCMKHGQEKVDILVGVNMR